MLASTHLHERAWDHTKVTLEYEDHLVNRSGVCTASSALWKRLEQLGQLQNSRLERGQVGQGPKMSFRRPANRLVSKPNLERSASRQRRLRSGFYATEDRRDAHEFLVFS
jgi:hypothetical protein